MAAAAPDIFMAFKVRRRGKWWPQPRLYPLIKEKKPFLEASAYKSVAIPSYKEARKMSFYLF